MQLDSNMHSVFFLHYHLIFTTKYRRDVFDNMISHRAMEIFIHIASNYNITLEEWNAYKSASSRLLKKEFPQIREKLWKQQLWSQSYCLISVGDAPLEIIKQYIKTQGKPGEQHDD